VATKIGAAALAALLLIPLLIAAALGAMITSLFGPSGPSATALADIPPDYLALYRQAAPTCQGLDWSVLAAVGKVETDHGRSSLPGVRDGENSAGGGGPMQFLSPTFAEVVARHALPPGGADPPSRYLPHDAVHAAAHYLCDNGARNGDLRAALFVYNRSTAYVDQVLAQADTYRAAATGARGGTWPAERATVPDPTGTGGQLTPRMHTLYQALAATGATSGGATCWDAHLHNPTSDHPLGRACDIFFDADDPTDVARGWQTANWLSTAQPAHGISYLIWQGRIWTARSPTWAVYRSDIYGCPDPANLTGCHYDHIHISVD